jgi:hypothetical protein
MTSISASAWDLTCSASSGSGHPDSGGPPAANAMRPWSSGQRWAPALALAAAVRDLATQADHRSVAAVTIAEGGAVRRSARHSLPRRFAACHRVSEFRFEGRPSAANAWGVGRPGGPALGRGGCCRSGGSPRVGWTWTGRRRRPGRLWPRSGRTGGSACADGGGPRLRGVVRTGADRVPHLA